MNKLKYKLLNSEDLVSDSYKQINDSVEAMLRGFKGSEFPDNPVRGQMAFIDDKWHTFNGDIWLADHELHNHDNAYYTKSQSHTKEEVAKLFENYRPEYTDIKGLPEEFTPCGHDHKVADITNFPVSLPAAGGTSNAAHKLVTARMIGDQVFDGTRNIQLMRPDNFVKMGCQYYLIAEGKHRQSGALPRCQGEIWIDRIPAVGALDSLTVDGSK